MRLRCALLLTSPHDLSRPSLSFLDEPLLSPSFFSCASRFLLACLLVQIMPVCPQCDNRSFSNKEALLQHMKSSSAWHPFCSICDRRFVSQPAFDAHMAAKHPPTYDCTTCNRSFHAPFALEDHYRGATAHPNCGRCGRGFKDDAACAEHHRTAHPKSACIPCTGGSSTPFLVYDDILDQHYWDSPNHPSCTLCSKGFKDTELFNQHRPEAHPELYCRPCGLEFETAEAAQTHLLSSPIHPKCDRCNLGFQDAQARDTHFEEVHNPTTVAEPERFSTSTPLNAAVHPLAATTHPEEIQPFLPSDSANIPLYSTGFTPLSPRNPVQRTIVGERRTNTPDLRLEAAFTSPITEVQPLFSPTGLPRPGGQIDQLWSSRENVQVTPPRFPALSSYSPPMPRTVASQPRPSSHSETSSSSSGWYDNPRALWRPREGQSFPPTKVSALQPDAGWRAREGSQFSPPQLSPPRSSSEFHPRLYPGSARAASLNRQSPPSEPAFGRTSRLEEFGKMHRSFGSASTSGGSISSSFGRSRAPPSEQVNWEDLIGPGQAGFSLRNDRKSLFDETLETLTPKAEVAADPMEMTLSLNTQHTSSPSLATVSSPASSALGHSPLYGQFEPALQPDTRPTTASSTHTPSLHKPTYTITPSSECPSPRSPEVSSPVGLGVLPAISPLASTPIDIPSFDIPEAQKPLPDSPVELSPVTVVVELKPQSLAIPSTSPLSTSSSQSFITSPQELSEDPAFSTSIETAVTSPVTPVVAPASESTKPNPLHCRVCLADSCDDITASMCGHIFCNRCITDAVIKTSRCPVCMTPTLLYCLFRLDLAA
ncbi:hypothetical protein M413DRAFT_128042 [Hebeloma cylindrosporum]|uniref:RING-type domain-containing protein n=1 Tax=Hebeloma cylindrosporum TaxID=76867 RepID=A0A0C3CEY4_HEBCY|nr:hypothetical protein M413DRAFT_128042 [Hebeloma cylindrosporum h7]